MNDKKLTLKVVKTVRIPMNSFKHIDIGKPAPLVLGSVESSNEQIKITACGEDIWGRKDEFHFSYFGHDWNFDICTKIENLDPTDLYTKAGIMAREDLTEESKHIFFQVFPDNNARNKNNGGYEFQFRATKGGEMEAIYPESCEGLPEFPVNYPETWIRLKRTGQVFSGFAGTDGENWKKYTQFELKLPVKLFVGLAVTSHNINKSTTATFSSIFEL